MPQPSQSLTGPPNLQPFFDDMSDNESQSNFLSLKVTAPRRPFRPSEHPPSRHVVTSLTFLLLSLLFSSSHSGRERSCVCLTTDTHSSPLPLPNPTPPSLQSAPKYVPSACLSVRLCQCCFPSSIFPSRPLTCTRFTHFQLKFQPRVVLVLELQRSSVIINTECKLVCNKRLIEASYQQQYLIHAS